jgi:hypothetical protein
MSFARSPRALVLPLPSARRRVRREKLASVGSKAAPFASHGPDARLFRDAVRRKQSAAVARGKISHERSRALRIRRNRNQRGGVAREFASKLTWIGIIDAKTEKEAIEKAAEVFKVAANRLIANPTK